jgi:hypothetical protein
LEPAWIVRLAERDQRNAKFAASLDLTLSLFQWRCPTAAARQRRQRLERRACSAEMVEQRAKGARADILTANESQSSRCSSVKSIGSTPSLTPNARSRCRITAKMEPNSYVAKHAINPHSRVYRWDDNRAGVFCALARRSGLFASS